MTLTYPTHTARYVDGRLMEVKVTKGELAFGPLQIGNPAEAVTDLLGEPDGEGEGRLNYSEGLAPVESLSFTVKDDQIAAMEYSCWFD